MRRFPRRLFGAALALSLVAACGGGGLGGDTAAKFAGTWQFASGDLTPTCSVAGITVPPFSLIGLDVTFSKVDSSTIQVVTGNAGCSLMFTVSGNVATAKPGQTCKLDTGTALGVQMISVTSWTLTLDSTEHITTNISAAIAICTGTGTGVLVPAPGDGGAD